MSARGNSRQHPLFLSLPAIPIWKWKKNNINICIFFGSLQDDGLRWELRPPWQVPGKNMSQKIQWWSQQFRKNIPKKNGAATGQDCRILKNKYLTDEVAELDVYCRVLIWKWLVQITNTLRAHHICLSAEPVQRASTTRLLMLLPVRMRKNFGNTLNCLGVIHNRGASKGFG